MTPIRKKWNCSELLEATGGKFLFGDPNRSFSGISIDSRAISPEEIFVAIKGETHDGHRFLGDVVDRGICCLIIEESKCPELPLKEWETKGVGCVAVSDTTRALGDLAGFNRKRYHIPVIAITGSNGKTTTRKMTASVAGRQFCTLSSRKNFNNEIGVPLTLFELSEAHERAVLELGMNNPGEIRRLAEICQPDAGIITNIGPAHIGRLGSMDAIMNAKGELLEKIKSGGTAVLNADDPRILQLSKRVESPNHILFFGVSQDARIRAESVQEAERGISFTLVLPEESIPIRLGIHGTFMVSNALAAAAAGYLLGLSGEEIKAGLEGFEPAHGRMNILETRGGIHIIDDTYNANPGSAEAAIMTLKTLKGRGRGIFVVGDMFELGDYSQEMHKSIGSAAVRHDVSCLYATGQFAEAVAAGAKACGMDSRGIFIGTKTEIAEALKNSLVPGDWVLVKGSRAMAMEDIVELIMDN